MDDSFPTDCETQSLFTGCEGWLPRTFLANLGRLPTSGIHLQQEECQLRRSLKQEK